ncbi:50S ribosomal protein L3 [Candidatus Woesearchaeota archaeon]|nr:50S ribosomal protein L3 [Candidatus Woesearchaeota archaeon]
MAKKHHSRHGSMQFWPRKRAKRIYPRTRSWPDLDGAKLLGFAGYKAGMTQVSIRDNTNSITKGQIISVPATIIECPPLKPLSLRFYQQDDYGLKIISEIPTAQQLEKELSRKIRLAKKNEGKENNGKTIPENFDRAALQVYTQPKFTSLKKKPEIFEIGITNPTEGFLKDILSREIRVGDVFTEGQFIDVQAVTTGKGFQGPVKRFGITLRKKKSEKTKRGPGSLGGWKAQQHIMYRVAHAGQMGLHSRTDYNKLLLKISSKPEEINPKQGLNKYGLVKTDYILLRGSVSGPKKRLIRLREPIRSKSKPVTIEMQ